jgi:hypothetical protein
MAILLPIPTPSNQNKPNVTNIAACFIKETKSYQCVSKAKDKLPMRK